MRIPLATLTAFGSFGAAVSLESDALQAISVVVGIVATGLGAWWGWRDRREEKRLHALEEQVKRERLHDLRADGDNVAESDD